MNIIFGLTGNNIKSFDDSRINQYIKTQFGQDISFFRNSRSMIGIVSDDGVILGQANTDKASLFVLGTLHNPLPDWSEKITPLDDANLTATYLLNRFLTLGLKFLDEVNGQYSIVIQDHLSSEIHLCTDPTGMRTWFTSRDDNDFKFSTHLRSLHGLSFDEIKVDRSQEDFFLIYGFYPLNHTAYQGITTLPKGVIASYGATDKTSEIKLNPVVNPVFRLNNKTASVDALTKQLYDAFMTAVEEQSANEKKAAVLLGGFDSALVAAALKRLGKKVETYSFYYQESQFNQPKVDILSQAIDSPHHWITIDQDIFADGLEDFSDRFNQPTNWPNYVIQTSHLCEVIRNNGINYCYSGDGCDTIFLGYPGTYKRAVLLNSFPTLPNFLVQLLISIFGWEYLDYKLGHPYRVFLNLLRAFGREMPARGFVSFRIMDELSLAQLRVDKAPAQDKTIEELLSKLSEPFSNLPPLRLAYQGKSLVSPNKNKIIGSSDQNGISILSPYLHPGLKDFASSLPEDLFRPDEKTKSKITGKYLLMKMAEENKLLPDEVIYQPKVAGVDGPIDEWYAGPLNSKILGMLKNLPFESDQNYLKQLSLLKTSEGLFKEKIMTDKVISHALSLLITYASFSKSFNQDI